MTDGKSDGGLAVPAQQLKQKESVFSIGIGRFFNNNELRLIASKRTYCYSVNDFQFLVDETDFLAQEA
jgi:hypothetical protein